MVIWKRNLLVCWFGMFITLIGMSQIAPILPLYLQDLGVSDTSQIAQLSGIAFGITFLVSAIFSPIWGKLADQYGRKPMLLRASLGMAVVVFSMGFAYNVSQFIILRLLQGIITGYSMACTTLIATQTDRAHAGWALGTLSTAFVSGSLLGPLFGGYLAETIGMRSIFYITGGLLFVVFITTLILVKEEFTRPDTNVLSIREVWRLIPDSSTLMAVFITSFIVQLALYSIQPIITIYITLLSPKAQHIAFISGLTFSASGLATILAAPRLGRLADKIGAQKVLLASLVAAGVIFIPQAFVNSPWQLLVLCFLLGIATAGLVPSINALVKYITPDAFTGRVFGFNISAQHLGTFTGSVLGGQVAAYFGIRSVFFVTSSMLLINALWVYKKIYSQQFVTEPESCTEMK